MTKIAKLFLNGRSQAVRLPAEYRFEGTEVYIRRDEDTGDVVISKKPNDWKGFFDLLDVSDIPHEFMDERNNPVEEDRELF